MKRIAVFVFFDKEKKVDDYVDYYLAQLKENTSRIVIVANGALSDESRKVFEKYATYSDIIVRENRGFDAWAYKAGIEHIGRGCSLFCDELIIANDTVFGPVYPFAEIFKEMDAKPLDFWGITKHDAYVTEDLVTRNNPYGYVPAHLQTYFVAFRRKLLESDAFWDFWERLLPIEKYEEAVGKFETIMTKRFEDAGFVWDSLVHVDKKATDDANFSLYAPAMLLRDYHMPFLKCRVFKQDTLTLNAGEEPRDAFEYIKNKTSYDEDLIWRSLLRRFDQIDFVKSLALTYVLPRDVSLEKKTIFDALGGSEEVSKTPLKSALIMHIFYPEMAIEAANLAKNMPEGADIFVTTDTRAKAESIKDAFEKAGTPLRKIYPVRNRGRSESALIVGMKDIVLNGGYDVICFWKEKVSAQVDYHASASWAYKINENLLGTKEYVGNILKTFKDNPRLGILGVTGPFHSVYHWVPGHEWAANFENTKELAEKLSLSVPMKEGAPPAASFGGAFWFRPAALKKLFEYAWKYEDFPEEPLEIDGTLLHAIERIYPFVTQDAGFYPAFALTDRYASLEITNMKDVLQGYIKSTLYGGHQFENHLQAIEYVYGINTRPIRSRLKRFAKRKLPPKLYICILGAKRVILGPKRAEALREIKFRLFRTRYVKKMEKK